MGVVLWTRVRTSVFILQGLKTDVDGWGANITCVPYHSVSIYVR